MKECIVCRYSEIALKGKNRYVFEDRLIKNLVACLRRNGFPSNIRKLRGRIIIYAPHSATDVVRRVFGIVSLSPAFEVSSEPDKIKTFVLDHASSVITSNTKTFRITTNRQDKRFPVGSMDFDRDVGGLVADKFGLKVQLKDPDINLEIDIHHDTYIFSRRISGLGGLPVGVSGTVLCIIDKPEDLTAGYLMLKRGCSIIIRSDLDCSLLESYDYGSPIVVSADPVEELIEKHNCLAIVVPWLLEDFDKDFNSPVPILTPLIGYSQEDIKELFRRVKDV